METSMFWRTISTNEGDAASSPKYSISVPGSAEDLRVFVLPVGPVTNVERHLKSNTARETQNVKKAECSVIYPWMCLQCLMKKVIWTFLY